MQQFLTIYGNDALVCTISPNNGPTQHQDHKALGMAAENLLNKGLIKKVCFFIEPYHFTQIAENPQLIPVKPTIHKASSQMQDALRSAIQSYSYWNPAEHRYAVGYHSVHTEFDDFLTDMTSFSFEKCNPKMMTFFRRLNLYYKK